MCRTPATRRSNRNSLAEIVECAKSNGPVSCGEVFSADPGGRARTSPAPAVKDASHRFAAAFGRP
jgi:hypothetical protein